ncbi:septal ring lytic transglycosylase RlpA family protein [Pleionea sp. CnH1-48]|uniref:septal ring lytic transglycosylase RlpA family protein n=1 Tax=Pleionea sp. CnH1-48 TaxID=2954494 RepID=UPI00273A5F19|nr:septal ring lytic transglycosylase RlpA family protein [Pleionea sp. CnH1-48]
MLVNKSAAIKGYRPGSLLVLAMLLLSGCAGGLLERKDSGPSRPVDVSHVPDAVPQVEPLSPYGNPASYEQDGIVYRVLRDARGFKEQGIASWYGTKFHGQRTSSGEAYDMYAMTAAHKTLPLPSYVKVTNLSNQRSVVVKVNDRGPFKAGRIIDLSYAAASKLGFMKQGTTQVHIETIVPAGSHQTTQLNHIPENSTMYVQVGAFSDKAKANKIASALRSELSWRVLVTPFRVNGNRVYRVRVGPVMQVEAANRLVASLTIPELGTPKIVFE